MKKSTYFLFAVVVILLCFIFLFEKKQKTTKEIESSKTKIFIDFLEDVETIERKGFEDLKIEKEGENYFLTFPFKDSADEGAVKGFIEALKGAVAERIIKENIELKKLGLDNPQITVAFKSKDKTKTIKIGNSPPLEKGVYFQTDDKIGVLSDFTLDTIKRSVNDFKSKELCAPLKYENVKKISYYKGNDLVFEFEKINGKWYLSHPFKDLADERKATFYIEDVILWPIMNFEDDSVSEEKANLVNPNEKYEVETNDGNKILIKIGALKDEEKKFYYASVSTRKGIFAVSKNSVRNIDKEAEDFRALAIFSSDINKYESLILSGAEKIVFKNVREKGWIEEKERVKEDQIKTFLFAIENFEGEKKVEKIENLPLFIEISLIKEGDKEEVFFYEDKENLVAEIKSRKIFVSLSKEDSERMKGAVKTIFSQFKENVSH
ncbi:MAG: DUF4340 domain-containing protein [Thermoanaerobaculaceae bacterium]|nr:DUF4340 domain-containing protein [Thermoanaerobaculaceae bacterium]